MNRVHKSGKSFHILKQSFLEMNLINFLVSMYKVQVHASGILFVLIKHYEISFLIFLRLSATGPILETSPHQ